jgi:hypothetical protein
MYTHARDFNVSDSLLWEVITLFLRILEEKERLYQELQQAEC